MQEDINTNLCITKTFSFIIGKHIYRH